MASVLNRLTLDYKESVNTKEYPTDDYVINPDLTAVAGIDKKYWVIDGDSVREMTVEEKDANVAVWIAERRGQLVESVNSYGEGHYDFKTEARLKHLYNKAVAEGMTNRAALIDSALQWDAGLIVDWATRDAELKAATTYEEVMAVTLDFSNHDDSDPAVTVGMAWAVND